MPSVDREGSQDRELVRHSHSFSSDVSRLSIPMWDSSDPERAPPPLPLNPGSPNLSTRPNTSAAIAQAAKALEEKARESMPASSYTTNPMQQRSPERSLIKGAQHKRMQSLQTTSVRDLRSFLDGVRSPERSPERPSSRSATPARELEKDYFNDGSPSRVGTPTPTNRDVLKETPALRPSTRSLQKAILGENTPPSATMLALQTMTVPREHLDPPLTNVTNTPARAPQGPASNFDGIATQLLSITNIVSNLQKDMTQLSRRSKDNASDLIGLKEATSARDEDIRKSLKELLVTMHQPQAVGTPGDTSRSGSTIGFKDPHMTPTKQFSLPRIPSPNSFMLDERIGSPNPYSVEGAASVAMLEKIIREMVTKDGQERLIANLQTLVDKATGDTAKKVTELVEFVKQGSAPNALVHPPGSASFQASPGSGPLTRTTSEFNPALGLHKVADGNKPYASPKAADFVSEEMLKFLRKIKDSVAESGCVTMGTKAMIQDLRGEVLGMGRELARKIEEIEAAQGGQPAIEAGQPREEVAMIVQEGLASLKQHMDETMRERRRQSMSSVVTRQTVDNQEVYDVVKHALAETTAHHASVDQEAIIAAIREAYESYKPNVEIQQFGLERDEILQCLREGMQEYQGSGGVSRDEVMQTIQTAIQEIRLPPPINEAHEVREEVLMAVRECLDELKPSLAANQSQSGGVITQEQLMNMIQDNLSLDISPESLQEAMKVACNGLFPQTDANGDAVIHHLRSMLDDMHSEFKAYSSANGRDTEQVLDALRDGLDNLRGEIEKYVDKAQDVTHKDEIVDNISAELDKLRVDVQSYVAEGPRGDHAWSRVEMVDYIKSEFENLHEGLASQLAPRGNDKDEIIAALNAALEGMKSQVVTRGLDLDDNEEMNEAMKQEFDNLKADILNDTASNKDELLERLQPRLDNLHAKLDDAGFSGSNDQVLTLIREEFEHLRETLGGSLIRAGGAADKDDIIDAMRELIDGLQSQLKESNGTASEDRLSSIQGELEELKTSLGSSIVRAGESDTDKDEIFETIKSSLDELKQNSKAMGVNEELLEAFRGELEQVRQSTGLTRQHARADTEEVLEAVRLGLDDLRSHMEKKLDNPESRISATNEMIDALNDGLEGFRSDVAKMVDKPVDMTVSYEILDTLKDGLASLREDIDKLKGHKSVDSDVDEPAAPTGNEVVLAESTETTSREIVAETEDVTSRDIVSDSLRRNDLEKMEVMLSQLQIKVEAMDANIQNAPPAPEPSVVGSAMKDDLVGIEDTLKELQATVLILQDREAPPASLDGMATKEDTDAIEILLGNIKAKIEEMGIPDPAAAITKENFDDVELVVRTTSESLDALSKKIAEEGATKGDVAVVQVIVDDIKIALDEMKAANAEDIAEEDKVTKTDIDALAELACDIKAKIDEMKIPDAAELPSKADVDQLTGLVNEFRDSHEKMKDGYEKDLFVTATIADARKKEAEDILVNITEVKTVIEEVKEEIKTNLAEGGALEGIQDSIKTLEDTIIANNMGADVKELMETVSREFERAHGSIESLQNGQEEKSALALEKQEEAKEAIISGLVEKVDDRFNTLMTKYDDAQLLADEQAKVMKEKAEEQEKILDSTKTMAEELRLTIDTLGASIAGMNDRFEEATQKWTSDSATVFAKIDETFTKLDEQKLEEKTEHSHTRDEIANVERIFTGLQDNITEYHPKFMVTLREIEALVKQHYEQSQKAKEEADEQVRAMNEEAKNRAQELQTHFSSLPALLPPPPQAIELPEKYDDARVQEKLDKLIGHVDEAEKSTAQLERLDEIHKQVLATAAEVSDFVAKQTQLITDGNESKEREAEELGLVVERKMTQKEQLDADIERLKEEKERVMQELKDEKGRAMAELKEEKDRAMLELKEEKDSLLAVVAALQVERENLANQKVRLTGEVSSLHTALDIRREELNMMDAKADALERRILNGIMDHSRALMMVKGGPKSPSKLKKRSSVDTSADAAKLMPPPSTAVNGLSLALKPRPAIRRNGPPPNPASRRIHSLSMISGNAPNGVQGFQSRNKGLSINTGSGLSRSHSVKTNFARKGSWHGRPSVAVANKENAPLSEEDETETEQTRALPTLEDNDNEDAQSETGTERRHSIVSSSYGGSYVEGETPGYDGRSSYGGTGSEYTYASGSSYMTGSDIDRRTSYGSTAARSTLLNGDDTIDEDSEAEHSEVDEAEDNEPTATIAAPAPSEVPASEVSTALPTQSEVERAVEAVREDMKNDVHFYAAPSDSALGSDLPTALIGSGSEADYFRRAAEEESTVG